MQEHSWQYLQISDALDREFVSALTNRVPVLGWEPKMSYSAFLNGDGVGEADELVTDPPFHVHRFPLQKGYWRPPFSLFSRTAPRLLKRLLRRAEHPTETPLICSVPYYAPVAELWPGPVVYYLTDLIAAYAGTSRSVVEALDRRMCKAARLVCPNSRRLADYLISQAGCPPEKVQVIPNATRGTNILPAPLFHPMPLPPDSADLPRPVVGVIGNMAGNIDWLLLKAMIKGTPQFSWLMVGPTNMEIPDQQQREARAAVLLQGGRVRFVGRKPYGDLAQYAQSFDAAVLPYIRREPTYSGSSTRFYEHLAACRPMLATRGFEELLHKEPLLRLIDNPEAGVDALLELLKQGFDDGQVRNRWLASKDATWESRAAAMQNALDLRVHQPELDLAGPSL